MQSSFNIKLNQPVLSGLTTIGKFDGRTPSLVAATTGGKLLIHSPHENCEETQPNNIKYLNLNRKITSIASGNLKAPTSSSSSASSAIVREDHDEDGMVSHASPQDHLFVGSESSLLSYNVERNADQFFIDVADGVKSLAIGKIFNNKNSSVILAGGNCSVIGYDRKGNEVFWTVTADNVTTLAIMPTASSDSSSSSEQPYILVGSEDFELRLFQREDMIHELSETDITTLLTPASSKSFAYGLNNGTIGYYEDLTARKWRVKTKNIPTTMLISPDTTAPGKKNLVTGWKNGNITIRNLFNGEIIQKDTLSSGIAGTFLTDYRLIGKEELIFVTESGEVVGYDATNINKNLAQNAVSGLSTNATNATNFNFVNLPSSSSATDSANIAASNASDSAAAKAAAAAAARAAASDSADNEREKELQSSIEALLNDKLSLYSEIKNIEKITKNYQASSLFSPSKSGSSQPKAVGNLPPNTSLVYSLSPDDKLAGLSIHIEANSDMVQIINVIIVDPELSILGDKDVLPFSPKSPSNTCLVTIQPKKHQQCSLRVQTHLAPLSSSSNIHVFEAEIQIPKFSTFRYLPEGATVPKSFVTFSLNESCETLIKFLMNNFIMPGKVTLNDDKFRATFMSVCSISSSISPIDDSPIEYDPILSIAFHRTQASSGKSVTKVRIYTENIDLAGEILQAMLKDFNLTDLDSDAEFPIEFNNIQDVIERVNLLYQSRNDISADMAEDTQKLKALVIRAEDSRLMLQMNTMRQSYIKLQNLTRISINSYQKRQENHETLLKLLKFLNQFIQKAANLRGGKAKTRVITECRAAIKSNNLPLLLKIIKSGSASGN